VNLAEVAEPSEAGRSPLQYLEMSRASHLAYPHRVPRDSQGGSGRGRQFHYRLIDCAPTIYPEERDGSTYRSPLTKTERLFHRGRGAEGFRLTNTTDLPTSRAKAIGRDLLNWHYNQVGMLGTLV
jgi:hypothetical protein